jgi:calreticulin
MKDAHFYAVSSLFDKPFDSTETPFVLQFSVKFEQNIDCGGGYAKVMPYYPPG